MAGQELPAALRDAGPPGLQTSVVAGFVPKHLLKIQKCSNILKSNKYLFLLGKQNNLIGTQNPVQTSPNQ